MNLCLVSLNSKYVHSSIAVWYLAAAAGKACSESISVEVSEYTINQPEEETVQKIAAKKPDVLAFSCYIWNISLILKILPKLKESLPRAIIVLGGPEVSYNPEEVLGKAPGIDTIICGEGEAPFPQLLNCLESGDDLAGIPGLCFRLPDHKVQCNPPAPPLTEPPSPYSDAYLQSLGGRISYLETSRGCPFSCAFCLSGISGQNVRFFDTQRAKNELLLLANSGTQTVKLVDRTFNCNPARSYELFQFIIENAGSSIPPGICFHFEVAADLFDQKTLDLLAAAPPGLIQLEAGLQTFNPQTLEAVSRKTDTKRLEANIRALLAGQNIHIHIDLIAGLPHEGLDSFADSFDHAYSLSPHMLQLGFLKMLHGSALRGQAPELGYSYSTKPPYEVLSSPWLSQEDLQIITFAEYALEKLYNSGRFLLTLAYVLKAAEARPFGLFCAFGEKSYGIGATAPLNDFARFAYEYFTGLPGVQPDMLRDQMVCDFLSFGCKIPDFLKREDKEYKAALSRIRKDYFNGKNDIKINAALLYAGGKRAVFADGPKNTAGGRYPLQIISLD